MNKDQFWEIIDSVNRSSQDKDQETHRCRVIERLTRLSLEEIMNWHLIQAEYGRAADRQDLWEASTAMGGAPERQFFRVPGLAHLPWEGRVYERCAGPGFAGGGAHQAR